MITQQNLRSILPGKIARVAALIAAREGIPSLEALRRFYLSPVYRKLEDESSKYWWMSPDQLSVCRPHTVRGVPRLEVFPVTPLTRGG